MNPLPQTLASETADALNALIHESDRLRDWDSIEIQTLIRAVEKLQKVDAREAFVRFGALSAICGRIDDVSEYYKKAIRLPGESMTRHEFWVSLGNAGLHGKALELGSWLLDPKRGFFQRIWQHAVSRGHVLDVWDRLPDAKKTFPELSQVDFSILENVVELMGVHGLRDQDVVAILDLMGEIQRSHQIMYAGDLVSNLGVMRPAEDPPYLYLTIALNASVGEIHAMNRELASLVVERLPDGTFPQGIVASFVKAHPVELLAAA